MPAVSSPADEEFFFPPSAVACDDLVLCLAQFAFFFGIAVNTGIAACGVPVSGVLPLNITVCVADIDFGSLIGILVVELPAEHYAKIVGD